MHTVEEGDQTREEAKELRLFAKEFGQGVRQQRVRGKTQEKAGTLPLAISMMKRIIAPQTQSLSMLEELQGLEEDRLATSRPLGERSEPCLAAKRPTASVEVARGRLVSLDGLPFAFRAKNGEWRDSHLGF